MSRLDRYYIPPGVPARPPAPPLPRKGILLMPPPPVPPPSNAQRVQVHPYQAQQVNWAYATGSPAQGMLHQPQSLPMQPKQPVLRPQPHTQPLITSDKIRPERVMTRRPIPNMNYEELKMIPGAQGHAVMMRPGSHLDSQNLASAMSLPDASPRMALQKILMLYENGEHREAAAFMRRLSFQTFRAILPQLPADIFIESMPHSLPILEALYAKLFVAGDNKLLGKAQSLRPEAVIWQLVKFFANQDDGLAAGQMRWEFCGPFISSCKRLLQVLLSAEPRLRRLVSERKRALMKAIEGLGQHGMVGTEDEQLMNLHKALKLEFEKAEHTYNESITKLEQLSLLQTGKNNKGTINGKAAPIAQSHQRQLSLKSDEIQERLIKNKSLLNVVEPTLENTSLEVLLGILQKRIELDKECLFQYTQIKKDSMPKSVNQVKNSNNNKSAVENQSVAPVLMRYQRGCQQVLELIREVSEDDDKTLDGESGVLGAQLDGEYHSDISGYHSDSESCVMTSGNSPFISKEARYSFLTRSVRLGSKHNIRASILASSLCLDSASLAGLGSKASSIKGPGSIVSEILGPTTAEQLKAKSKAKASAIASMDALHSSSGVSSGSTDSSSSSSETGSQGDKDEEEQRSKGEKGGGGGGGGVGVAKSGIAASGAGKMGGALGRPPRHPKQRSASSLSKESNLTSASLKLNNKYASNDTDSLLTATEPIYQGIIERDISVIRKEAEIASLNEEVKRLKGELSKTQKTLFAVEDSEKDLRDKLTEERQKTHTLEKMVGSSGGSGGGGVGVGVSKVNASGSYGTLDTRPSGLVKRYGELYSQMRLETLDDLDKLVELVNSEELKNKLLFSVMVLAFRSVTSTVQTKRDQVRRILQLLPLNPEENAKSTETTDLTLGSNSDPASRDMEDAISVYLRRATENFDLSKNVEEVCTQIWATLYDYPCLKSCDGIIKYVKECVRVAWGLVNQVPSYVIEYEERQFRNDLHVRFHLARPENDLIQTYLWPALLEGENGPCVQKGVVIT